MQEKEKSAGKTARQGAENPGFRDLSQNSTKLSGQTAIH